MLTPLDNKKRERSRSPSPYLSVVLSSLVQLRIKACHVILTVELHLLIQVSGVEYHAVCCRMAAPAERDQVAEIVGTALTAVPDVVDLDTLIAVAECAAPTVPAIDFLPGLVA